MGKLSPRVLIGEQDVFMAIRTYIDRSGQAETRFVSLAAFGAPDDVWARFERGWADILTSAHSPITYMHMKEAMQRLPNTPFSHLKGWNQENAWTLVFKLAKFMSEFESTELINFSCVVNMDDWRKVHGEGVDIPSEIALCNAYVPRQAVATAAKSLLKANAGKHHIPLTPDDMIHIIFDRNEPFFAPFDAEWNAKKDEANRTGTFSPWLLVDSVGEGTMEMTPGIQAADILAWGLNRENTAPEGHYGTGLASILRNITAGTYIYVDEDVLRRGAAKQK
ncbi:MAG: DUF3800 domain-containing protein [Acidobacteriaceae bacterium]